MQGHSGLKKKGVDRLQIKRQLARSSWRAAKKKGKSTEVQTKNGNNSLLLQGN